MSKDSLNILYVSHVPPSPPRFGAQARVHGLITEMARKHDVTALVLLDSEFDARECEDALRAYCRDVVVVPNPFSRGGVSKRLVQLGSVLSPHSYERLSLTVPGLQKAIDRMLASERFDVVNLEFPYLGHLNFRQAPPGSPPPVVVVGSHEIAYDLGRQFAATSKTVGRRLYAGLNWRKLRRDELAAYRQADGVSVCSSDDEIRLHNDIPGVSTAVVPNAADVDFFQPRVTDPAADGHTVVFFGLLSTMPNIDGVKHLVADIWPRIAAKHPDARLKIVGGRASNELQALAGPNITFTGFVDDLRPHLASASVIVVPLRLGGGTRLKIVEAMAMGKPIVSTSLGAEGIQAKNGRDILIEDDAEGFAAAVSRVLSNAQLAREIGGSARELAVARYSWRGAAQTLDGFYRQLLEERH